MTLKWMKCQGDVWCKLNSVNLDHEHFDGMEGVYIIWHGGPSAATVYVGQGNIRDRLIRHRSNPVIQRYDNLDLYVTWAAVPSESQSGVEKYLADTLGPKEGDKFPDVTPVSVNVPW